MSRATKVKLCPTCLVDGVWRYSEDGTVLGKHGCAEAVQTPAEARDQGIQTVTDAKPRQMRTALDIISDFAVRHQTFTANDCRIDMDIAQIDGPVVGAAFGQAVRDGLIHGDGYVPSTLANTHGHPVRQWRSRIYRGRAS